MTSSFFANPNVIRSQGSNFANAADEANRISEDLDNTTSGLTPVGGDDKYGAMYWSNVEPALTANRQVLLGAGQGFNTVNDNLDFTADQYTKVNDVNTDIAGNMYT
jgi:hypothetical protein